MRILSYLEPVAGCDVSLALRLAARWRSSWVAVGYEPLCLTEGYLMAIPESKSLLEAYTPRGEPFQQAANKRWMAAAVLKDGEEAIIAHYDAFPGPEPWSFPKERETMLACEHGAWLAGTKEQFLDVAQKMATYPEGLPTVKFVMLANNGLIVHYNTLELRATLFPQTVQWHADKVEPPAQPQFGRQFAPRNKR